MMRISIPLQMGPVIRRDYIVGASLVTAYFLYMLTIQPLIQINDGLGWDGYYYYRMAVHQDLSGIYYPLWLRYLMPFMAASGPTRDVFFNFQAINLIAAVLHGWICYLLLVRCAPQMHAAVPVLAWFLVCASNLAPIPSTLWYPVQTDSLTNLLSLLFLMIILSGRVNLLAVGLIFLIGTGVRENFPQFLIYALLAVRVDFRREDGLFRNASRLWTENRSVVTLALVGVVASIIGLYSIQLYTGRSPFEGKTAFMMETLFEFHSAVQIAAATVNSIGVVLVLLSINLFAGYRHGFRRSILASPFAWIVLAVLSVIALVGGTNTERYWYWGMPLFVIAALPAIDSLLSKRHYVVLILCMAWASYVQRAFVPIHGYGIDQSCSLSSILTGSGNWLGHWVQLCNSEDELRLVALALIVTAVTLTSVHFSRRRFETPRATAA